jgi:hypothetical protein
MNQQLKVALLCGFSGKAIAPLQIAVIAVR